MPDGNPLFDRSEHVRGLPRPLRFVSDLDCRIPLCELDPPLQWRLIRKAVMKFYLLAWWSACATMLAAHAPLSAASIVNVVESSVVQNSRQPQAAVRADGTIFVAFGADDTIYCCRSVEDGTAFQPPVRVGHLPALALGRRRGPRIVANDEAIVVTAISHDNGNLFAWRSTDDGESWSDPVQVNDSVKDCREGLHAMALAPNGNVFCTWLDLRSRGTEIFGSHSADGGASWSKNHRVYRSPSGTVCECCHPSATYHADGSLHVMWRNSLNGSRDMFLASSANDGQTFSQAKKLGQQTWKLNACPMDGGYLASTGSGKITTVWRRDNTVYRTDSADGAETVLGRGLQPWVAGTDDGAFIAWLSRLNGPLMYVVPGSATPRKVVDAAADPVIVSPVNANGPVVIVWETGTREDSSIKATIIRQ